ncbi:pilus assembly protein [Neobacillus sp. YIM B02564]|uniref:Pilus assembly protein n=1 Tax=Neobacillus paridis TaxID=2803862 RepID=A0ABS1TPH1_9BACI|nr:TadE/TadG family type IV pilus assembly protein [Neobacillus paridis]MBL4952121.1 pilus assembly protein [Neobacillus paridis]
MLKRARHFQKSKKAQSLAEFALILPVMVMLIGMIISGGQLMFSKLTMQMAAYEGARVGVTQPDLATAQTQGKTTIKNFVKKLPFIEESEVKADISAPNGWVKGEPLDVNITYNMKTLFPVPGTNWDRSGSSATVLGNIQLSIENAP